MNVFDNPFELLDKLLILRCGVNSDGIADEGIDNTLHKIVDWMNFFSTQNGDYFNESPELFGVYLKASFVVAETYRVLKQRKITFIIFKSSKSFSFANDGSRRQSLP